MSMIRLIPMLAALSLCACTWSDVKPRPTDFGDPVTLGPDCSELAGKYYPIPQIYKFGTAVMLRPDECTILGDLDLVHPCFGGTSCNRGAEVKSFALSFPEKGTLRVDTYDENGALCKSKTWLESMNEYRCADGMLNFRTIEGDRVDFTRYHVIVTSSLTRTTKKYLQMKWMTIGIGGGVIPSKFKDEDWYFFPPM